MIHLIHIDPRLDRCLEDLRRAGKKGQIAADNAETVIQAIKRGGPGAARHLPKTHRGELRLESCVKYNLGGGYRLLTIRQGGECFLLFAGSHDDCHRWLENNRDLAIEAIRERCRHHWVTCDSIDDAQDRPEGGGARLEEWNPPEPEFDQRTLRLVFAGLCGAIGSN
jgi:hypothetical protein